jgi:flagellar motility protein MotE (MotC chaperone)
VNIFKASISRVKGDFLIRTLFKITFISTFIFTSLLAEERISSAALIKQKIEVKELKKELNIFYNKKEEEYQKRKKELDVILSKIEKEKNEIESLKNQNLEILKDIKGEVESKTTKIYNKMKPKIAAGVLNQMIAEGKVEDVFAIILKIKESNVTALMKYLSIENASTLTLMLENYKNK